MKVFSTSYLPDIAYIQQYLYCHKPVIDLGEYYIKQTHRNRGYICSSNGPLALIVPLRKLDSKRVGDIEISYAEKWQDQHVKTIRSCYKNSPYFEHYQPEFESLITTHFKFLYELNDAVLQWLLAELDIPYKHTFSNDYIEASVENDYRNEITTGKLLVPYKQVFSDRNGFCEGMSVVDLLFNKGPESLFFIK